MNENLVMMIGRLGQDPDVRATGSGSFARFSVALNRSKKLPDGTFETLTTWVRVKGFDRVAERVADWQQGDLVCVRGRLNENKWQDKSTWQDRRQLEGIADRVSKHWPKADVSSVPGTKVTREPKQSPKLTSKPAQQASLPGASNPFDDDEIPF